MEPLDNKGGFNPHESGKAPGRPRPKLPAIADNVSMAAAAAAAAASSSVPRSASVDGNRPARLSRQANFADLHTLLEHAASVDDRIDRAYSSLDPYSPPPTPHSGSPLSLSGAQVPQLEPSAAAAKNPAQESNNDQAPQAASRKGPLRIPRFLAQDQAPQPAPLLPPLDLSFVPLTSTTGQLAAAAASSSAVPATVGTRQHSARFLAEDTDESARSNEQRTPTSADRNRALTPRGKGVDKLPDYTIRKNSADEASQQIHASGDRGSRDRRPTPRRLNRASAIDEDTLPIVMARSAPLISRALSTQERDNINLRLNDKLRRRMEPSEKATRSAVKIFIKHNTELWRCKQEPARNTYKILRKESKPLSTEIADHLLKSPIVLEHLNTHLSECLMIIVNELDACKKAQQVQALESWSSSQNNMENLLQKLAAVKTLPTPEAIAELLKQMNGTSEALKRTLDAAASTPQSKLEPGEDWNLCISTLREIIFQFQRFDIPLSDKIRFYRENARRSFDDRKVAEIFDLIMRPLASCCDYLDRLSQKELTSTVRNVAEKALKDSDAFALISSRKIEWTESAKERHIDDLTPCTTLRTLFTHKTITVNGSNFDALYKSIPVGDFSQRFEGPAIPQSIQDYYIAIMCSLYNSGLACEFNVIEEPSIRNTKIRQFAAQQLQRIIENKLLDIDVPMAQIFRLMSTECWSRCELFVREGMPKLFKKNNSPIHTGHATGNSTTCHITITGPNKFSVTLSREYEIHECLHSEAGGYSPVPNREKLLSRFKLDWTVSPAQEGHTPVLYKALLTMSMPEFTTLATPKIRWKVRRSMATFR